MDSSKGWILNNNSYALENYAKSQRTGFFLHGPNSVEFYYGNAIEV